MRLPKGVRVVDRLGKPVRKLTITALPVARPPHPLPASVYVPTYFTIQPGSARILGGKARIIYPNYRKQKPGTSADFWHYNTDQGWYVYATGKVSPDGKTVVPKLGAGVTEFTGAMYANGPEVPVKGPNDEGDRGGDPVDLSTGTFIYAKTDLAIPDVLPISLKREYNSKDHWTRAFGLRGNLVYDSFVRLTGGGNGVLVLPSGATIPYVPATPGANEPALVWETTTTSDMFFKSRLVQLPSGEVELRLRDGMVWTFGGTTGSPALTAIRDRFGNRITLRRKSPLTVWSPGTVTLIKSPNGRWIRPTYNASEVITGAADNIGRSVSYTYTGLYLTGATDPAGGTTAYTLDPVDNRVATIKDARNITFLTNRYDANGRVDKQTMGDGAINLFAYSVDGSGNVTRTDFTDGRGLVHRRDFDASGRTTSETRAFGTPDAQTMTYERNGPGGAVTATVDHIARRTEMTYDTLGNPTSVIELAGTANARSTTAIYQPAFSLPTQITDPLSHSVSVVYDANGAATSVTNQLGKVTTIVPGPDGQPTSVSGPLARTSLYSYDQGARATMTDPLGRVSTQFVDGAGRAIARSDGAGRTSRATFNALDRPLVSTNPVGGTITRAWDPNRNLLSLTDERGKVTTFTYENMDRPATRTDPKVKVDSFTYDSNGNLATATDRLGRVTRRSYDNLDRPSFVGFGESGVPPSATYQSSITATYDTANRVTQLVDTVGGTISFGYDALSRLSSEMTPEGIVGYTYDAADRRTLMTIPGQAATSYTYDNANRPLSVTRGTVAAGWTYDDAGRVTASTMPGGVSVEPGYNTADELTALVFKKTGTTFGQLTYGYDRGGLRTEVSGSFGRTGIPAALATGTYDDANRLTARGATSYTYDDVGNMTGNGTQTFGWNPRGQLTQITGGTLPASFVYDAKGRRRQATFNGVATSFLYDGQNVAQDLQGGTAITTYTNGLAIDSTVARTDAGGTQARLADALGSTVALTDAAGNVATDYTHDPFGTPTTLGAATSNRIGYAGREIDPTGLSFNRNRYYNPSLSRFTSEDPIGFAGGQTNLFAYVGNNPTQFTDPFGLSGIDKCWGCAVWDGLKGGVSNSWDFVVDPTTYTSSWDYWTERDWQHLPLTTYEALDDVAAGLAGNAAVGLGILCGVTITGEIVVTAGAGAIAAVGYPSCAAMVVGGAVIAVGGWTKLGYDVGRWFKPGSKTDG